MLIHTDCLKTNKIRAEATRTGANCTRTELVLLEFMRSRGYYNLDSYLC